MKKSNGYILHEDLEKNIIVIINGVTRKSKNRKTGNMLQVWILRSDMSPVQAIKLGLDVTICGTCPHRGNVAGLKKGELRAMMIKGFIPRKRSCYVNVGQAPAAVYRAYKNGSYPKAEIADFPALFGGRAIRLGAYGDPAVIPQAILEALVAVASRHTGYTHQWTRAEWLKPYVMASCDSPADFVQATHHGWRTFRVTASLDSQPNEILCPASTEAGNRTQCERCGLCNGAGQAKNIFIPVHGSGKKNALVILQ